jgi:uncharacterized repeat protein (TIGR01451 family)
VAAGETVTVAILTVTITAANYGLAAANYGLGGTVTETLPDGFSYVPLSSNLRHR